MPGSAGPRPCGSLATESIEHGHPLREPGEEGVLLDLGVGAPAQPPLPSLLVKQEASGMERRKVTRCPNSLC